MATQKNVTLSTVIQKVAQSRDIDATKAGKLTRSYIRGHDADLRKSFNWPPKAKGHKDGNRYPEMPPKCAAFLVSAMQRKS